MISKLEKENKRLKTALYYIMLLEDKRNMHLGRPRLSDKHCIYCMSFFALNNGSYGEHISTEQFETLIEKIKGKHHDEEKGDCE